MNINFFNNQCKELPKTDKTIGICDDQDGKRAYTDSTDPSKWLATIKNENQLSISFTAIDNCMNIIKEESKNRESTCDGMLTFSDSLFLVELKKQRTGGWISDAIGQLENTIKILLSNHNLEAYKYKKAFACNRRHPRFTVIDNERNKRFFNTYGFRLDIQAEIVVK